jgi:hypothetical protein
MEVPELKGGCHHTQIPRPALQFFSVGQSSGRKQDRFFVGEEA